MDIKLLPARIDDLKCLCDKTNTPKFIGFLTAEEGNKFYISPMRHAFAS